MTAECDRYAPPAKLSICLRPHLFQLPQRPARLAKIQEISFKGAAFLLVRRCRAPVISDLVSRMSDSNTVSPVPSITASDLLNFALDHAPNKAKKEVGLYVKENLSKAPMFKGVRTSSNTFLDGATFRNRIPTSFKNSLPSMSAFIKTLLRETHVQLLADKKAKHEDPFKAAGEFAPETVYDITEKLLTLLKGKPEELAAHVLLLFFDEFLEADGKGLSFSIPDERKDRLSEVLGVVLTALDSSEKSKAGAESFKAYVLARQPQSTQDKEARESPVEPKAKPAAAKTVRKTKTTTSTKSRVAKLVSDGFDAKKSNPAAETLLTTAANSLSAEATPAQDTHTLRSKIEAVSLAAAVSKTTTAGTKAQEAPADTPTEENRTAADPAAPAPEPEPEPAPYVAPDNFPIENEFTYDVKPARGKTRSLGCVRRFGNKFTNLFLVANWSDAAKRFIQQDLSTRFPSFGAVSLDSSKSPLKINEGSFFIFDWSDEIFYDRKDGYGGRRSDYALGVDYDDIVSSGALRRVEDAGGYVVVYPDLPDNEAPNLQDKVSIRFRRKEEPEDAENRKLLHLNNVPVLLAVGDRLYGPLNLLEDSLHRPYVNLQLRSGSRVIKGFDRTSGEAPLLTVEQSCQSGDSRVNVKVDVIFVTNLQRCAYDMLSDDGLLSKLSASIAENRSEREKLEEWAATQLETSELFCEDDRIHASRKHRIRSLLQRAETNDRYFDSVIALLAKTIDRRVDDQNFFDGIVKQFIDNPELRKRLESHRVVTTQLENLREMVSQLETRRDTLQREISRTLEMERKQAQENNRTLLEDNRKLAQQCSERRAELGLIDDIEELTQQKKKLQTKVDDLSAQHSKISSEINAIDDHLKQAVQKAHAYAFDGAIASKLLQAASDWESDTEQTNFEARARVVATLPRLELTGKALAEALVADVQSYRAYDKNTILNFFILLTQNFLTVFSGEPGSGKTSICEILSYVLGLRSMHKMPAVAQSGLWKNPMAAQRFLTVPVERGWTSKRDFIGYYNPLSKTFESTDSRRREAFAELHAENQRGFDDIAFVMLLDEANLSPMEYYWGDFMRICDNRTHIGEYVSFGGEATYSVPDTLRFLATINNDFTTENLSPRLLDRANIVKLPEQDVRFSKQPDEREEHPIVSWHAMKDYFGPRTMENADEVNALLEDIYAGFKNQLGISVSMRTRLAIQDYVSAGAVVFTGETEPAYRTAIDFAVVQRLMPRIDGNGKEYRERLEAMQSIFDGNGLDRSRTELAELIERGEKSMGWYRFF